MATINRITTFNLIAAKSAELTAGFYLLPFIKETPVVFNLIHTMPAASKPSSFALIEPKLVETIELDTSLAEVTSHTSPLLYKLKTKNAGFIAKSPDITVSEIEAAVSFSEVASNAQAILYKARTKQVVFVVEAVATSLATTAIEVSPKAQASHFQVVLSPVAQKPLEFVVMPADKNLLELEIDVELLLRKMKFMPVLHYGTSHNTQELTEGFSTLYFMGIDGLSQPSIATWYPILLGEYETYSYERYLTIDCVYKGTSEEAYDFKLWADLTAPEDISLYYGFNLQYVAPKQTKSLIATIQIPESFEEAAVIPINSTNERMQQIGDKTMYIVLQVAVKPTATGNLRGDLHIAWKEIM